MRDVDHEHVAPQHDSEDEDRRNGPLDLNFLFTSGKLDGADTDISISTSQLI